MSALRSDELTHRVDAIAEIQQRGTATPAEVEDLVHCLGDPYKPVQRRAAEALLAVQHGGVAVVEPVRVALQAPSLRHRWGAVYALSRLGAAGPEVTPILVEVLGSDDGDRRWAAAQTLVGMASQTDVAALLRSMLAGDNPVARKMALYCWRDLGTGWADADAHLSKALADADATVRLAALSAVVTLAEDRERLATACVPLLADGDLGVSRAAAVALGKLGSPSELVQDALRAATTSGDEPRARAARTALARLAQRVWPNPSQ